MGVRNEDNTYNHVRFRSRIEPAQRQGDWERFDVQKDISAAIPKLNLKPGAAETGADLLRVVIGVHPEGGANDFWLDSVELCTPTQGAG